MCKYSDKTDWIGSNWGTPLNEYTFMKNLLLQKQIYQNKSIRFGVLKFENRWNAGFEQEMISLEEGADRDI